MRILGIMPPNLLHFLGAILQFVLRVARRVLQLSLPRPAGSVQSRFTIFCALGRDLHAILFFVQLAQRDHDWLDITRCVCFVYIHKPTRLNACSDIPNLCIFSLWIVCVSNQVDITRNLT